MGWPVTDRELLRYQGLPAREGMGDTHGGHKRDPQKQQIRGGGGGGAGRLDVGGWGCRGGRSRAHIPI